MDIANMMQSFWADEGQWPHLKRSYCVFCQRVTNGPTIVRLHDDEVQLRCAVCGRPHSRRENDPESRLTFCADFHFLREPLPAFDPREEF